MQYIHLLIKPVSGACNMKCAYCFYMDEADNREKACYGKMSKQTVRQLIKRVFEEAKGECSFTFQGGEPTLAGIEYYKYFQNKLRNTKHHFFFIGPKVVFYCVGLCLFARIP